MALTQKQSLYEQYKMKSDEELQAIIASDEYEDVAKEVAKEILNGDRTEYRQMQERIEVKERQREENNKEKLSAQQTNPLYDDIHQIAGDVRFMKNVIIVGLVIAAVALIVSIIGMH